MKTKSLFISTIAMVVLLVVALATGTFAWYSAQSQVTATNAKITTAEVTNASINLTWNAAADPAAGDLTSTTFGAKQIGPMIPTSLLADYVTGGTPSGTPPVFTTATIENISGTNYFKDNGTTVNAWEETDETLTSNSLYVMNLNPSSDVYVRPSVTFEDPTPYVAAKPVDNFDLLRVAIYSQDLETNEYEYMGTWGPSTLGNGAANPVFYGTIVGGAATTSISGSYSPTASGVQDGEFVIGAYEKVQIYIYAWLEGTKLDNDRSMLSLEGSPVVFSVVFDATTTSTL